MVESYGQAITPRLHKRVALAEPIFHCPKCLQYWISYGIVRRVCLEPVNPVHGKQKGYREKGDQQWC